MTQEQMIREAAGEIAVEAWKALVLDRTIDYTRGLSYAVRTIERVEQEQVQA